MGPVPTIVDTAFSESHAPSAQLQTVPDVPFSANTHGHKI